VLKYPICCGYWGFAADHKLIKFFKVDHHREINEGTYQIEKDREGTFQLRSNKIWFNLTAVNVFSY
jgi:hypothetical protein